jgi:hypothetical protein
MAQLPKWFDDYNSYHPHSALSHLPAKLFRAKRAADQTYRRYWVRVKTKNQCERDRTNQEIANAAAAPALNAIKTEEIGCR